MKNVIIGTAGHVDHGKTLLIKALTGIDTDRLVEEKKRGITIELGFAHINWPDGLQAGIVDVPGHEKFIRNMLAGAGGIDFAMLVVAADEGFMPQTVEHLNILTLLGIRDGILVITKKDMVEPEWLEMMQEEITDRVKGTFLEGKPVMTVSAYTGEGIPELREKLHELVLKAGEKSTRVPFRLPVDRVFSVDGFGTVVTGTLIEGCVSEGDPAQLMPGGAMTRVRNLQVHGETVKTAYAGQRVAINLAGLKKTDVNKGDAVARPGSLRVSMMLDVRLTNLADSGRVITNNMQIHFFHGAATQLAKVVLLDRDELEPGGSCYAQLRLTENVATKNGDRFVIRFYSPLETIGGGVILDDAPVKHKRNVPEVLEALKIRESGSGADRTVQVLAEFGLALPTIEELASKVGTDGENLRPELEDLISTGRILEPMKDRYISSAALDGAAASCMEIIGAYHKANPLHAGIRAAELRQKLFRNMDQQRADALLGELVREGIIRFGEDRYALAEFTVKYTKRQTGIRAKLLDLYTKAGIETPTTDEVLAMFAPNEKADVKQVLDSLLAGGGLVMLSGQICYGMEAFERAVRVASEHFRNSETITLAEMRDEMGTSRKYALAVLEYFDKNGYTKKTGDLRKQGKPFPAFGMEEISEEERPGC